MAAQYSLALGHFMATRDIPLSTPFDSPVIPAGDTFDIHDISGANVLIKYEGIRVWKSREHFFGCITCLLPNQIVADDGFHLIPAQRPLQTFVSTCRNVS